MTLLHASQQPEAEGKRRVELEIAAVAFGKVAESLARVPAGTALRCEGFLARRYRTGTTLALHIDRYELNS
jgi:primosomal replication protein N